MGTAWEMPLAVIGKPTGDGRQFDAGALTHRDLPLPLRYVASDTGGHSNAVIVGHISEIGDEKGGMLPAKGEFYDDDTWPTDVRESATAARMFTQNKVIGPSVDLDQQEVEHVPEPKAYAEWKREQRGKIKAAKMAHASKTGSDCGCSADEPTFAEESYDGPRVRMIRAGRMASATMVHIPAFAELSGHAKLTLEPRVEGENEPESQVAAMIENDSELSGIWLTDEQFEEFARKRLPVPSKEKDGDRTVPPAETGTSYAKDPNVGGGGVDRSKIKNEDFVDPDGRRFPIVTCADVPDAVSSYGRANPKIPMATFKSRLTAIAKRKGCEGSLPDSWKAGEKMAALMAAAAPAAPPREWFDDPQLTGPTPLHIADDGRVYGHVAVWDTCHVGIGSSCVKPPKSQTSYAYFHTGETVTADGSRLPVGRLTYGSGGHAGPNLGYRAAAEHYDNSNNTGALVRAGEDAYGIWVAGAVIPEADDAAVRAMRSTPLSGDWRRIGGNLEMVAALHVNTAGFPIPRMMTASADETDLFSLVAAGSLALLADEGAAPAPVLPGIDPEALGRAIARGVLAEQADAIARTKRAAEWADLVASATAPGANPDYDDVMGELLTALDA